MKNNTTNREKAKSLFNKIFRLSKGTGYFRYRNHEMAAEHAIAINISQDGYSVMMLKSGANLILKQIRK